MIDVRDDYDPIAPPPGYQRLDFLPLALRFWYLLLALTFFIACEASTIVLIILSQQNPHRFERRDETQRKIFQYSPVIVGSTTSLWWLSISRTYRRILPYMAMAAAPIGTGTNRKRMDVLNNIALARWSFSDLFTSRDWKTMMVSITHTLIGFLLIPSKAAFIQAEDVGGEWTIQVSFLFGSIAAGIYLTMIISVILMTIRLYRCTTGLKWDPASLASQLTLLPYLDPQDVFTGTEYGMWKNDIGRRNWSKWQLVLSDLRRYGVLRLGYWRHKKSGCVVHGIRILSHSYSRPIFLI